jgi:membrane-associated phospholipid phosphatase
MTGVPDNAKPAARLPADPTSAGPLPSGVGAPAPAASALLLIGFLGLTACLVLLGVLAEGIRDQEVYTLDVWANPFFHGLASPFMDTLMNAATFAGSNLVIPPLFVLAIAILIRIRRPGAALYLTVTSGGSLLLNGLMKIFFQRPRPQLPWASVLPDYSFPSGHTMNSVAFYVALAVIFWSIQGRRTGMLALTFAIVLSGLIGLSRIYLGYHYFTDVLGGILAGTSWLLIVLAAFRSGPLARFWRSPEQTPTQTPAQTRPAGKAGGRS